MKRSWEVMGNQAVKRCSVRDLGRDSPVLCVQHGNGNGNGDGNGTGTGTGAGTRTSNRKFLKKSNVKMLKTLKIVKM